MKTKVVHCKREKADVYIGRPSILGNPFAMGNSSDEERERVVREFKKYMWKRFREDAEFAAAIRACEGKTLGCFCAPKLCHGHAIVQLLNYLKGETK